MRQSKDETLVNESAFHELADVICNPTAKLSRTLLSVQAESSDFVRFNRNQVRQATQVSQYEATLSVVQDARQISSTITLGPDNAVNVAALKREHKLLVRDLPLIPDDPYLLLPESVQCTSRVDQHHEIPPVADAVDQIIRSADQTDLVGFYASGPGIVGFADSRGQRNWHRVDSFHFDWSIYLDLPDVTDRAVKASYAGKRWHPAELAGRMTNAQEQLEALARPARTIGPGNYRAYITPAATSELLGGLAWSGFSRKERATGTSSLSLMAEKQSTMNAAVQMTEATVDGIAPGFTNTGYLLPESVTLIAKGETRDCLVSPRSAAEFRETPNCDAGESPQSLALAGGTLDAADALAALDTGIWIGNLWYVNYSDRPNCRMTGMTRFASFWVERGQLIAPITPMRFDDSLIRLFGDGLLNLTKQPEFMPDASTWGARHLSSVTSPGLLVRDMAFTL